MITKTQKYLLNKLPNNLLKNIVVDLKSGCWLWQTNINGTGYGRVSTCINGKEKRTVAHKFIYNLLKGHYKKGLVLDHVYCTDRRCCNPTHVSPVTQQQNTHRGKAVLFKAIPFKPPVENNPDFLSDLLNGIDEPFLLAL